VSLEQPSPVDPRDAEPIRERVTVRRAPKVWGFLALGAIIGVVAALILTFAFRPADGGPTVTEDGTAFGLTQVFGFLLVCLVPIGAALGALVAIVLDRVLSRRAVEIDVDRIDVAAAPDLPGERDAADDLPSDATPNEDSQRS
jgi:hypothetical protein